MLKLRLGGVSVADLSGRDLAWLEHRRGALNVVWRKCGKPNCRYARPGHRGHGPQYNLTRRAGGKTVNTHLKPGPELEKAEREVAEHQRFLGLVKEVSEVSRVLRTASVGPDASLSILVRPKCGQHGLIAKAPQKAADRQAWLEISSCDSFLIRCLSVQPTCGARRLLLPSEYCRVTRHHLERR
jgi:hypothetical protein